MYSPNAQRCVLAIFVRISTDKQNACVFGKFSDQLDEILKCSYDPLSGELSVPSSNIVGNFDIVGNSLWGSLRNSYKKLLNENKTAHSHPYANQTLFSKNHFSNTIKKYFFRKKPTYQLLIHNEDFLPLRLRNKIDLQINVGTSFKENTEYISNSIFLRPQPNEHY